MLPQQGTAEGCSHNKAWLECSHNKARQGRVAARAHPGCLPLQLLPATTSTLQKVPLRAHTRATAGPAVQDHYGDAESCAHEIARCYGRRTKATCAATAQYLCLAQVGGAAAVCGHKSAGSVALSLGEAMAQRPAFLRACRRHGGWLPWAWWVP